eukprot:1340714-Prymnesium_polylepis.1
MEVLPEELLVAVLEIAISSRRYASRSHRPSGPHRWSCLYKRVGVRGARPNTWASCTTWVHACTNVAPRKWRSISSIQTSTHACR